MELKILAALCVFFLFAETCKPSPIIQESFQDKYEEEYGQDSSFAPSLDQFNPLQDDAFTKLKDDFNLPKDKFKAANHNQRERAPFNPFFDLNRLNDFGSFYAKPRNLPEQSPEENGEEGKPAVPNPLQNLLPALQGQLPNQFEEKQRKLRAAATAEARQGDEAEEGSDQEARESRQAPEAKDIYGHFYGKLTQLPYQ